MAMIDFLVMAAEAAGEAGTVAEGATIGTELASSLSPELGFDAFNSANSVLNNGFGQGMSQVAENTALNPNQMLDPLTGQPSQVVNPQQFNVQQQRMQELLDSGGQTQPTDTGEGGIKSVQTPNTTMKDIANTQYPDVVSRKALSEVTPTPQPSAFEQGFKSITDWMGKNPYLTAAGIYGAANLLGMNKTVNPSLPAGQQIGMAPIQPMANYTSSNVPQPNVNIYRPRYAAGGILQAGGPVEHMSQLNTMGNNQDYPGAKNYSSAFSNPNTMPIAQDVVTGSQDVNTNPYTGEEKMAGGGIVAFKTGGSSAMSMGDTGVYADTDPNTKNLDPLSASLSRFNKLGSNYGVTIGNPITAMNPLGKMTYQPIDIQQQAAAQQAQQAAAQNMTEAASGGIMQAARYNLGGYASGGNPRLLDGPGDGMSDNIAAVIGDKQPARLADGEFVVPADVVSGLGNGSTKAGAKKLHGMMDKVRVARTGTKKQGKEINPDKFMPS